MPSGFVRLEALPLTPNGKVDRRALAALGAGGPAAGGLPSRTGRRAVRPRSCWPGSGRRSCASSASGRTTTSSSWAATRCSRPRWSRGCARPSASSCRCGRCSSAPTVAALAAEVARARGARSRRACAPPIAPVPRGRRAAALLRPGAALVPRPARARQRRLQHPGGRAADGALRRGGLRAQPDRDRPPPRGPAHHLRHGRGGSRCR